MRPTATCPKSHFELLFRKPPYYQFLKAFGSECWPYLCTYDTHNCLLFFRGTTNPTLDTNVWTYLLANCILLAMSSLRSKCSLSNKPPCSPASLPLSLRLPSPTCSLLPPSRLKSTATHTTSSHPSSTASDFTSPTASSRLPTENSTPSATSDFVVATEVNSSSSYVEKSPHISSPHAHTHLMTIGA